jgi:hypothetical protein
VVLLGAALGGAPAGAAMSFNRADVPLPGAPESVALGDLDGRNAMPVFAAEESPLGAKSLAALGLLASTAVVVVLGGLPAVVLMGEVGLVVVRGLSAVGRPMLEGARPESEDFGGDTAAALLTALRRRLGIPRRVRQSSLVSSMRPRMSSMPRPRSPGQRVPSVVTGP